MDYIRGLQSLSLLICIFLVARPSNGQPPAAGRLAAVGGSSSMTTMGSCQKGHEYRFELELTSRGAGIAKVRLTDYPDLTSKDRLPLVLLEPIVKDDRSICSMTTERLILLDYQQQLPLGNLDWKAMAIQTGPDGTQKAGFEAMVVDANQTPYLRLAKTFTIRKSDYLVDVNLAIENLSSQALRVQVGMTGPVGIRRESILADMPKAVAAFKDPKGQILSRRLQARAMAKARSSDELSLLRGRPDAKLIWAGVADKYFAAILVPRASSGTGYCDWLDQVLGLFANPDMDQRMDSGDETVGLNIRTNAAKLGPSGDPNSSVSYGFQLYLGPKDKGLFDKDPRFSALGFVQVIDFAACCCPAGIINPLAFLILAIMKGLYAVIHNYGLVIILLVLLMRLIMHPVTRSSQIAMHKMSKLAPKAEEIRRRYANNKKEMNERLMALYREQGASPIMGFLPMLLQMPIWIALWTAVNTSIDLRGKAFLPFWITDLSAPDALISLPKVVVVPLIGLKIGGLNLLPILMGIAFYLQQKLTPSQASAANPELAQQQKIMMWMMPILFPLMLYNTASGVNLYIMTSTFAGAWEQKVIMNKIRQQEQAKNAGLVPATTKAVGKPKKKIFKPFFRF